MVSLYDEETANRRNSALLVFLVIVVWHVSKKDMGTKKIRVKVF